MPDLYQTRRVHSTSGQPAEALLGSLIDDEASAQSLVLKSKNPINKLLWIADKRKHHSEGAIFDTKFGKMPDWITMQGSEYQCRARSIPDFLAGCHYGYQHEVYLAAAEIFERLAVRRSSGEALVSYTPLELLNKPPSFASPKVKRQAYELAYETLKYQDLLEEILSDSGYFFAHPTADDTTALVLVMLFDSQNRKWTPRCRIIGEKLSKDVSEVEVALLDHRIRLAAALARCRVKNQALTIDYVLPESVRQQEKCASSLPQYAWVNTAKTTVSKVTELLEKNEYTEYNEPNVLMPQRGKFYRRDAHCDDVILFPSDQKEALKCLNFVRKGRMVLQDKTSSLAVKSVAALLTEDDECDLIHADVSSGLTTAHLAVFLHNVTKKRMEAKELMYKTPVGRFPSTSSDDSQKSDSGKDRPTVYAFGVKGDAHRQQLNALFKQLGLKNIKLCNEKFENVDHKKDQRFSRVKVILSTPQCTRTAVANPIDFMLSEGDTESYAVLREISHGERHNRANESGRSHTETLKSALKVPAIKAVVYVTRSSHDAENDQVVNTAIKWHRDGVEGTRPFRVCPPTLPLTSNDIKESDKDASRKRGHRSPSPHKDNFLRMKQSTEMNGCFIAVLTREIDHNDPGSVKDLLKRAALQGLIAPVSPEKVEAKDSLPEVFNDRESTPDDKAKRRKSKVAFGKRIAPKSGGATREVQPVKSKTKLKPKAVDSLEVDKMLETYKKETAMKVAHKEFDAKELNMNQLSMNLTGGKATTVRLTAILPPDPFIKETRRNVQKQMTRDVEMILHRMQGPEGNRG